MLADVIDDIKRASSPIEKAPNDSPTSALRSTRSGMSRRVFITKPRRTRRPSHDVLRGSRVFVKASGEKQKGTAYAMPFRTTGLAPPAFTAPCRNQTGDCTHVRKRHAAEKPQNRRVFVDAR